MSFIIRNVSAGAVTINDLGIDLLATLDEHDLSQEPPNDVAISSDLPAHITAGNIAVLDPLDGVTVLSIADALDLIASTNDPHYRIRGGRAIDVAFDNSGTDNTGTNIQTAVVDNSGKIKWRNAWAEQTYDKHDMVLDGDWTMIANKQTTDRAAPQAIGEPEATPADDAIFGTSSDTSIVKMVHHYVMTQTGWLTTLKVRAPTWDLDSVSRITIFNITSNVSEVIYNPILTSDEWVTIRDTNFFVASGDVFEVWFEFYNSIATNRIEGGWKASSSGTNPAIGDFVTDSFSSPSFVNIDHIDLDATDRSTELDGVSVGSVITIAETSDPSRSMEVEVTAVDLVPVDYTGYTVTLIQLGSKNVRAGKTCTVHIDVPITQPSQYSFITNYYVGTTNQPSWGTITTKLFYGGVQQVDVDDSYGIEVIFQDALVSADWDLVSTGAQGAPSAGGTGGEANTASNLGVGAGVFAQKNGTDLEFKSITAGTSIQITPSGTEIQITNLAPNIVQNLWSVIIGDTGTTAANTPTDQLTIAGGVGVSTAIVGDTLTITNDSPNVDQNLWETIVGDTGSATANITTDTLTIVGSGNISTAIVGDTLTITSNATTDLATVTVGTPSPAALPLAFADILWATTHVENDITVIEHDNVNTARILIKETGLYLIAFSMSFDADPGEEQISGRVFANGTTEVPGSLRLASEDDEINDLSNTFTAELTAGDYITFQAFASAAGNTIHTTSNFMVTRARGTKGDTGAAGSPGAGSNVIIQDEGVNLANTPHGTLNFTGGAVTATDAGGSVATINITANLKSHLSRHNAAVVQTFTPTAITVNFATNIRTDADYTHNLVTGGSEITINTAGWYKMTFNVSSANTGNGRETSEAEFQLNGTLIAGTRGYGYHRNVSDGRNTATATTKQLLAVNDVIRVQVRSSAGGNLTTLANGCRLNIESIDTP